MAVLVKSPSASSVTSSSGQSSGVSLQIQPQRSLGVQRRRGIALAGEVATFASRADKFAMLDGISGASRVTSRLAQALRRNSPYPSEELMRPVKTLSLVKEGLRDDDIQSLQVALQSFPSLLELDLSSNRLGLDWARSLTEAFKHASSLRYLALFGCGISSLAAFDGALEYTSMHGYSGLLTLRLGGNSLNEAGVQNFPAVMKQCPKLEELHLERNPIGEEGCYQIAEGIQSLRDLTVLNLEHCRLGPRGMMAISEALPFNKDLRELYLGCNNIGPDGAWELVSGLENAKNLAVLDLTWNSLGQEGVRIVALAVQYCRPMERLLLGGNGLDPAAEREFMVGLRHIASGLLNPPRDF